MTANQIYKQSGTTLPFNLWLGKMKSKHGSNFVQTFSMSDIEKETEPQEVVLNASGNGKSLINTNTIIIGAGLLFIGYCWYKMKKA